MGCKGSKAGDGVRGGVDTDELGVSKRDAGSRRGSADSAADSSIDEQAQAQLNRQFTLAEEKRRRLSVSTVTGAADEGGAGGQAAASAAALAAIARGETERFDAKVTSGDVVVERAAAPIPAAPKPLAITSIPDPALVLIDESRGIVREANVSMITAQFEAGSKHAAVFGAPASSKQRSYDDKRLEVVGTPLNDSDPSIGYACKKGLKPESPNQDDFFVCRIEDLTIIGVFDGHGPSGHDASSFVHNTLPFLIITDPSFQSDPLGTMRRAFRKVHFLLEAAADSAGSRFDCSLSGTTATVVIQRGTQLYVAHVGDSRAVVGKKSEASGSEAKHSSLNLTADHRPTRDDEKMRIERMGGEVRRLEGDIPHRVFLRNRMYPGE
eukprot:GHVU01106733.1.p1 GENE.GHVU01106733.1~~GHVU01106733.1.p1  ORF type:complete len:381 (-),score=63.14 GHVU01106733.1:244-1386(-)